MSWCRILRESKSWISVHGKWVVNGYKSYVSSHIVCRRRKKLLWCGQQCCSCTTVLEVCSSCRVALNVLLNIEWINWNLYCTRVHCIWSRVCQKCVDQMNRVLHMLGTSLGQSLQAGTAWGNPQYMDQVKIWLDNSDHLGNERSWGRSWMAWWVWESSVVRNEVVDNGIFDSWYHFMTRYQPDWKSKHIKI